MAETTIPPKPKYRLPVLDSLWQNPVILKELRGRMRGARAFILIFVYLVILSCILSLVYSGFLASTNAVAVNGPDIRQALGKTSFLSIVGIELMLVCFIAPALTAGAISSEREHQTYDLLRTTLLSARSFVLGKYFSSLSFILLLLVAAFPLEALASMMGGVAIEEVFISFLILVITAITFSAIGLFFSSIMKRTLASTVLAYATAILVVFGLPMLVIFIISFFGNMLSNNNFQFPNQAMLETVLLAIGWLLVCINPLATGVATELMIMQYQNAFYITLPLTNGRNFPVVGPWIGYSIFYLLLSLVFVLLSITFVRRTEK